MFALASLGFISIAMRHVQTPVIIGQSNAVYNRTLGFQKVFVVSMPNRPDKRDAISMAMAVTNIDFEFIDGVNFDDLSPKSVPYDWDWEKFGATTAGCKRAHLNALARIVKDSIQSALILEDDIDWDYWLKDQMAAYAYGVTDLQSSSTDWSPYGSRWDLHAIGTCRSGPDVSSKEVHIIHQDPTVPPASRRWAQWATGRIPPEVLSNTTRLVYPAARIMCMYAYAVSQAGARKMLTTASLQQEVVPIDISINRMCAGRHITPFNCYGIYPSLFGSHRFAGSASRDSDINEKNETISHGEFTHDIVYSVLQNMPSLVAGDTKIKSQWPSLKKAVRDTREKHDIFGVTKDWNMLKYPQKDELDIKPKDLAHEDKNP